MSSKNGTPQFNFRKMGYRFENKLSRLQAEIGHLHKQLDSLPPEQEPDALLDKIDAKTKEALEHMVPIVSYLPEAYLLEGISPDDVKYDDPENIIDSMCYGAFDRLSVDMAQARRDYVKKSTAQ